MPVALIPKCKCEHNPLYRLFPDSKHPWRRMLYDGEELKDGKTCPKCGMELTPTCRCDLWKWQDGAWRKSSDRLASPAPVPYDTRCCGTRLLEKGQIALPDKGDKAMQEEAKPEPFRCSCYYRNSDEYRKRYWERIDDDDDPLKKHWLLLEVAEEPHRERIVDWAYDATYCPTCGDLLTSSGAVPVESELRHFLEELIARLEAEIEKHEWQMKQQANSGDYLGAHTIRIRRKEKLALVRKLRELCN